MSSAQWSPEARAKRKETIQKMIDAGKWPSQQKAKKPKQAKAKTKTKFKVNGRGPHKLADGTFNTWSPEARAKRAATMAAKRAGKLRKLNGKHKLNGDTQHFPLSLIPERHIPAKRGPYVKKQRYVSEDQKLELANRILGLLENVLGST